MLILVRRFTSRGRPVRPERIDEKQHQPTENCAENTAEIKPKPQPYNHSEFDTPQAKNNRENDPNLEQRKV